MANGYTNHTHKHTHTQRNKSNLKLACKISKCISKHQMSWGRRMEIPHQFIVADKTRTHTHGSNPFDFTKLSIQFAQLKFQDLFGSLLK